MFSIDFYKSTLFSLSDGLLITNKKGEIVFANNALSKMFKYNAKDLIGENIELLVPRDLRKDHVPLRKEYTKNPKNRPHGIGLDVYAERSDNSTFPVEVSLSYFNSDNQTYVVSIVSDISNRKSKEQKIQNFIKEQNDIKSEHIKIKLEDLKKQISPHYLFNCLNILYSLIEKNPNSALQLCKKISETYSYVLETKDKSIVPLEKEIGFLKNYTYLQKIRFKEGFSLNIENNIDSHNTYIVPLALQLLIENAFKHNLLSKDSPLTITVEYENNGILVSNNITKKKSNIQSYGIGLKNLSKQCELINKKSIVINKTDTQFKVWVPTIKKS